MCFFLNHSFVALVVCFGSLSCWNTHPWPIFNSLAEGRRFSPNSTVHGPVHRPFDAVKLSCPLSRKIPSKHNVSTSVFDGGDGVLGVIGSILLLLTRRVELMPKSSILVSSDHNTFTQFSSESFKCSLANFRRACTCAFLRRILQALQDFSPSQRSALPIVFLVPAALR